MYMPQVSFSWFLITGAIAGIVSAGVFLASLTGVPTAMYLLPENGHIENGQTIIITVQAKSETPVNVFKGIVRFSPQHLVIEKIDYNTSIANLWAEEPWYSNGDGTMSFIGGTTQNGGFTGEGSLITITFKGIATGDAHLSFSDVQILAHDGLGTYTSVQTPIDSLFTVTSSKLSQETVSTTKGADPTITILPIGKNTDLNGDGLHTITDISIFMQHLATQNIRSDFNDDGIVSITDISIILNQ